MDYDNISYLKEHNIALKLLRSENAALIISFLFQEFKQKNVTEINADLLETRLFDYLFFLRGQYSGELYPDTANHYLNRWADDGYLRKFYLSENENALYELTPDVEKVFQWLEDLDRREFVGTESRLYRIFDILREVVYKSSLNPEERLKELEKEKKQIELEIKKIKSGVIETLDATQIKERFFELTDTARKLLHDFKQVEYNFRELDKKIREDEVNKNLTKGKFLENIFRIEDLIWETDQGKSFRAFWELLMNTAKQEELEQLIAALLVMPEISEINKDLFIDRLKYNLIEAGSKVSKTNHILIEHLSRYLDDKSLMNNRQIIEVVKEIKKLALEYKDRLTKERQFYELTFNAGINTAMQRPLFTPGENFRIESHDITAGEAVIDLQTLYQQVFIDKEILKENIRKLLKNRSQVTLKEITEVFPVKKGVAEIIGYYDIAVKSTKAIIVEDENEIVFAENIETDKFFKINMNKIIFVA